MYHYFMSARNVASAARKRTSMKKLLAISLIATAAACGTTDSAETARGASTQQNTTSTMPYTLDGNYAVTMTSAKSGCDTQNYVYTVTHTGGDTYNVSVDAALVSYKNFTATYDANSSVLSWHQIEDFDYNTCQLERRRNGTVQMDLHGNLTGTVEQPYFPVPYSCRPNIAPVPECDYVFSAVRQ